MDPVFTGSTHEVFTLESARKKGNHEVLVHLPGQSAVQNKSRATERMCMWMMSVFRRQDPDLVMNQFLSWLQSDTLEHFTTPPAEVMLLKSKPHFVRCRELRSEVRNPVA